MVRDCTAMKSSYKAGKKKEKGDNQKGGDQNRYRPFNTSIEVIV